MTDNNKRKEKMPQQPTGKRRGRKRKCETPITLPQIGEVDNLNNLRITNETPSYCTNPLVFGDIMIFSKKDEVLKKSTDVSLPLLPLLGNNTIPTASGTRPNINILPTTLRPPLPTPSMQSGLGSNVNFVNVEERKVESQTCASCWWCCHPFDWPPLGLPVHYDDQRKKFKVIGNFCSWNCMKAFNNTTNSVNKSRQHQYIHDLFRKIVLDKNGKTFPYKHIPFASSRWQLKMFGGVKTIEEFRGDCVLLDHASSARLERSTVLCIQPIEPVKYFK